MAVTLVFTKLKDSKMLKSMLLRKSKYSIYLIERKKMLLTKSEYLLQLNIKTSLLIRKPFLMNNLPHSGTFRFDLISSFSIVMEYADNGDVF